VSVILHSREYGKSVNTGRLAARCLNNSELRFWGRRGSLKREAFPLIDDSYVPVVLFPGGIMLSDFLITATKPIHLIVPDGSWSQGRKIAGALSGELGVGRVSLPLFQTNIYSKIRASKSGGLSTLGAIAHALGILEGRNCEVALLGVLNIFVQRVLVADKSISN
jgi:DTW domain-containing protein YfiP